MSQEGVKRNALASGAGGPVGGGTDGVQAVSLMVHNGAGAFYGVMGGDGIGDSTSGTNMGVIAVDYGNANTYSRHRCNNDNTLLASGARSTTQTSADITTFNCTGITVVLDMTSVASAPSVTLTINGKDSVSGKYYNLLTGAAVITVSTNVYRIQPGIPAVAATDVNAMLPRVIQIVVTANVANNGTYSVGYCLHN